MRIVQSKWLRIISIGFIIWGIILCLLGRFTLFSGMIDTVVEEIQRYYATREDVAQVTATLRRNAIMGFVVGCWAIVSGFGLLFMKKWAWWSSFFLCIAAGIYSCYRPVYELYKFHSNSFWSFGVILIIFISIIFLLIKFKGIYRGVQHGNNGL